MKPSVMITSPGSPDLNSITRSRNSRISNTGISSVGGRIQVSDGHPLTNPCSSIYMLSSHSYIVSPTGKIMVRLQHFKSYRYLSVRCRFGSSA